MEEYEEALNNTMLNNSTVHKLHKKYHPKYWWNQNINALWSIKEAKLKLHKKINSNYTKNEFKRSLAMLRRACRQSKRLKFYEFINDIEYKTTAHEMWNKIRIFNTYKEKTMLLS